MIGPSRVATAPCAVNELRKPSNDFAEELASEAASRVLVAALAVPHGGSTRLVAHLRVFRAKGVCQVQSETSVLAPLVIPDLILKS